MTTSPDASVAGLVADYVGFLLRVDPIKATKLGVHDADAELPSAEPEAVSDRVREHRRFLALLEQVEPTSLPVWLDWRTALAHARTEIRRADDYQIEVRAPYFHPERLGEALSVLMLRDFAPAEERAGSLVSRLEALPAYLHAAGSHLDHASPPIYVEMGITATEGLGTFLETAVASFSDGLDRESSGRVLRSASAARSAVNDYLGELRRLHGRARGDWRAGAEHFDFLLKEFHLLDIGHEELLEMGRERVETDRRRLEDYAKSIDPNQSWQDQIRRVKDRHPQPAEFVDTYRFEMERARAFTLDRELITIPEGEACRMGWVPEYMRASLPIAVMSTVPPFEDRLASEWLITPSDPRAPEHQRLEQMRDNCHAFAESIAGHETYPGHHLQKVHHKLATQESPMRRYFSSPLTVEGWGLYTEDLFDETGFFNNPAVMLFRLRNTLWRSVRVVIDTGLHTGELPMAAAVELLREQASLDTHMAEGEVRRYVRHDNPTYPSSYFLGCQEIHKLRKRWMAQHAFTYRDFHDRLLSFGSIPVSLIARSMLGEAEDGTALPLGLERRHSRN